MFGDVAFSSTFLSGCFPFHYITFHNYLSLTYFQTRNLILILLRELKHVPLPNIIVFNFKMA